MNLIFGNVQINLGPDWNWYDGSVQVDLAFSARNNLFRRGTELELFPCPASSGNWVFEDNLFEQVEFYQDPYLPLDFDHNGYWPASAAAIWWPGDFTELQPTTPGDGTTNGAGEVVLSARPAYRAGPFGKYYLSGLNALYQAGSRTAGAAGLAQSTTLISQTKEAATQPVSIGLHYVAAANRLPLDTDGDGIPDYMEDANGNGAVDANETSWKTNRTDGVTPDPDSTVYDNADLDSDGLTGAQERLLGRNPLVPDNPLKIKMQSGSLSGVVTLPLNIGPPVTTNMYIALNAGGNFEDSLVYSSNGQWFAELDTTEVTNGCYSLQLELVTNETPVDSFAIIVPTANLAWLPDPWNVAGQSIYLGVQTPYKDGTGTWGVNSYDDQGNFVGSFSGIIDTNGYLSYAGNTNAGVSLDNTDGNGNQNPGAYYTLVYAGDADHPLSQNPPYTFTNVQHVELPWNYSTYSAVCYQQVFGGGQDGQGELMTLMETVAAAENSVHPLLPPTDNLQNPYCIGSSGTWGEVISNAMASGYCRDFCYFGHGGPSQLGSGATEYVDMITAAGMARTLQNWTYFDASGQPPNGALFHPYRFVFLDGCNTANGQWPQAFGIPRQTGMQNRDFIKRGVRPRAFMGWTNFKYYTDVGGTGQLDTDHENYITTFWSTWANPGPNGDYPNKIISAINAAAGAVPPSFTKITIYGSTNLTIVQ